MMSLGPGRSSCVVLAFFFFLFVYVCVCDRNYISYTLFGFGPSSLLCSLLQQYPSDNLEIIISALTFWWGANDYLYAW